MAGKKSEQTGKAAASAAGKTLQSLSATKAEKSAAASALTQTKTAKEQTSPKAASQAGKVLQNPKSPPAAKTAAASALTQTADKKPAPKKK